MIIDELCCTIKKHVQSLFSEGRFVHGKTTYIRENRASLRLRQVPGSIIESEWHSRIFAEISLYYYAEPAQVVFEILNRLGFCYPD